MKIFKIHLQNFKRFTNLIINNIPVQSKLVLLIGTNGSGKSSLFDAFGFVDAAIKKDVSTNEEFWNYFTKKEEVPVSVTLKLADGTEHTVSNRSFTKPNLPVALFYGRTSFRQLSRLTRTALGQDGKFDLNGDADRPKFFIERDARFENDVERITEVVLKEFFLTRQSSEKISKQFIDPINKAFQNIFGAGNGTKLQLMEIIPPLEGKVAQITFQKGTSKIHYNYLGAGEKEVFNLLINLLSRRQQYQDTIYYFDEIDLHLNTKLQFNLLKEITENWIPENCQLWTASHSLGFIEYAKQSETASIIDFDNYDFDLPRVLTPEPKDNADIYEIAVGKEFLPSLFREMKIIFVEENDDKYYASVGFDKTVFVKGGNRNNVYHKVKATQFYGIVDRDFLSDDDITQIKESYPNLYILNYYSIENYFYHPDNLEAYYKSKEKEFDKQLYIMQLTDAKNEVKDKIIPTLSMERMSYPYFGESDYNSKPLQNRFRTQKENKDESIVIAGYLNSNDFETYYKSLPMKSYCTQLSQRQTISPTDLAKTGWFKEQITMLLK